MKSNKGFAPIILIFVVVAIVALALVVMLSLQAEPKYEDGTPGRFVQEESDAALSSPEPVSEDTDTETIEEELEATVVGEFETDLDSMEEDASGL